MDNVIKIPSQQANFDIGTGARKNLVDIHLPAGSVYDLSASYINVNVSITGGADADALAIYNNFIAFTGNGGANHSYPSNAILIKNAHARGQKVGRIEDLRRCDTLRNTLELYKKNRSEQDDDINKMSSISLANVYKPQPVNELYGFGADASKVRSKDIRIHLKDIFNFCRTENYDSNKYGALHLHFELNNDLMGIGVETINNFSTATKFGVAGQLMNACDDAAGVAANAVTLKTTRDYRDISDSPFYTGMPVIVSRNKGGAGVTNSGTLRIVNIQYDTANNTNKLILTTSATWTDGAGDYTAIAVNIDPTRTQTISLDGVECVAQVNNSPQSENLVYSTFQSQEDTYPAILEINRNYEIPENCKNIYIMFNTQPLSNEAQLSKYRLTIDGKEVTNRAVDFQSPLHYELINQVFLNNGDNLHSLNEYVYNLFNSAAKGGTAVNQSFMIAIPVPFLPRPQRLGVVLTANTGQTLTGKHIIYSEVVKSL